MTLMAGCGGGTNTTTTGAAPGTTTVAPETTTTAAAGPVSGGTLRLITNATPQSVGFYAKMGPVDEGGIFPGVERIMKMTPEQKLAPDLAKSVTEDPDGLKITVVLNPGIKFHDGTELTAEVAKWNYQMGIDGKKLQFASAIDNIEVVDTYTYVIHLNFWHNQLIQSLGWVPMFSEDAYMKSGTDEKTRTEWAVNNLVGTGPFTLKEYKRDESLVWVKNPNYWREGPLLDEIDVTVIPDATTAGAMMEAKQADIWINADAQSQSEMLAKGFTVQTGWAGFLWHLMPNTMDPKSPMNDQRVREAVEYALDKPAIVKAIGYGRYDPLYDVAAPGQWGSGTSGIKREYDPAKAKQLLTDAGYPNGLPIDLLAVMETGGRSAGAEAVKGYLDAAGFVTNLDIADPGRFYGSVFGTGWKDLALMFSGQDATYLTSASRWWSPEPMTNLASFKRPDDFKTLFDTALMARDEAGQIAGTEAIVDEMTQKELMIPLFHFPGGVIIQPWVHTDYMKSGFVAWDWRNNWMDEH